MGGNKKHVPIGKDGPQLADPASFCPEPLPGFGDLFGFMGYGNSDFNRFLEEYVPSNDVDRTCDDYTLGTGGDFLCDSMDVDTTEAMQRHLDRGNAPPELLDCAAPASDLFQWAGRQLDGDAETIEHRWLAFAQHDEAGDVRFEDGLPLYDDIGLGDAGGFSSITNPRRPEWAEEATNFYDRDGAHCRIVDLAPDEIEALRDSMELGTTPHATGAPHLPMQYGNPNAGIWDGDMDARTDLDQCQTAVDQVLDPLGGGRDLSGP